MRHHNLLCLSVALLCAVSCFGQAPVPLNSFLANRGASRAELNSDLPSYNPNLVEGRELAAPGGNGTRHFGQPSYPLRQRYAEQSHPGMEERDRLSKRPTRRPGDWPDRATDFFHTIPQGPGRAFPSGLYRAHGNGRAKRRSLCRGFRLTTGSCDIASRSRHPATRIPDLYLGQPSLNSATANFRGGVTPDGHGPHELHGHLSVQYRLRQ